VRVRALFLACGLASGAALAAGGGGGSDMPAWAPADPVITRFEDATTRRDWASAAQIARDALARNASNAEYHNRYAYALRNGTNPPMDLVFRHYNEALRLEPNHRGAHEYLGEAYLMAGNLAKAKEHLEVLDRLCSFGCDEYDLLKKAVAAHEAKRR
jgi:cytochrome c-type biogenesis protein CcmH/NrfG